METLKRLILVVPFLLLTTLTTKADTVYVDGSYAFANNGYGIPPYGGTLNGNAASFYCIDFQHDIFGQTGWLATETPLGSTGSTLLQDPVKYDEMAWLVTQMMDPTTMANQTGQSNLQTAEAELQWTIWSMSGLGGATNPYASWTGYFSNQAANNYQTVGGSWEILTPIANTGYTASGSPIGGYYGQEFLVRAVPEPSPIFLLLGGLALFATFRLKK